MRQQRGDAYESGSQSVSGESPTVRRVRRFVHEGRQCCHRGCLERFWTASRDAVHQFGADVARCSHEAKEAALFMNLRDHLYAGPSRHSGSPRQRTRVAYSIPPFGRMCRQAYMALWDIGESTLHALLAYMHDHANSFCPRPHGLTGTASNHALAEDLQRQVVDFIVDIGEQVGEEDEGRQSRRNLHHVEEGRVVRFLPASYTIAGLYRVFIAQYQQAHPACGAPIPVSFSSFRALFHSAPCQHVRIRSPRSNVCDECAMFRAFYRHSAHDEPDETSLHEEEHVTQWQQHVQLAREAREAYNADLRQACETLELLRQGKLPLAGYVAHYTFDFMQSLAVPQFADQTKEMYYFSLRNIHVFSIRDDGAHMQYNYLYDEGDGSKGANYVLSLLFHFLQHRTHETAAIVMHLHADNCSGQNKNNVVMQFFVLLVSLGLLTHVEMKFLIKGHTHCSVDGGHGMIKKAWRKHDVFTLEQAATVVEATSPTAGIHRAIIVHAGDFFDWEGLLSTYFCKLPKILSFQQFEMDAAHPGRLRYRQHHTQSWQEATIFRSGIDQLPRGFSSFEAIQQRLTPLSPPGIPLKKQHVLYEKVRKYVPSAYQDIICPRPIDYQEKEGVEQANINKKANTKSTQKTNQ
jgi:hypothetical protein